MKKIFTVILVLTVAAFFWVASVGAFEIGTGIEIDLKTGVGSESYKFHKDGKTAVGLNSAGAIEFALDGYGYAKGQAPGPSGSDTEAVLSHTQGTNAKVKICGGLIDTYNHTNMNIKHRTSVDP